MFSNLSDRITKTLHQLRGLGRLTESNIQATLGEIRAALLEADVALPVVQGFLDKVQAKAVGQTVLTSIRPGEALIKVVHDELVAVLGGESASLNFKVVPPAIILMAGLQGSGKTTTAAKLAKWLKEIHKKNVMLTSTDVYRPAAIDQLRTLATQINAPFFESTPEESPVDIAKRALEKAKTQFMDVLIVDTAGRLHIDDAMMSEIRALEDTLHASDILLVVDSMAGQDAAHVAKTFHQALPLTGVILTKTDGDARGGAALSMRWITEKPILFLGVGEKIDALEPFHPERVASRILGMGDIVSLVEDAQRKVDQKEADKIAKKIQKGKTFDFNDFLMQLNQMKQMGGLKSLLSKLPSMGHLPKATSALLDDKLFTRMEAMIFSMTPKERRFPALITGGRKQRITKGSGTSMQDLNKLLKQFEQMQKMLKKFKGNKMGNQLKNLQGKLPPELYDQLPPHLRK